MRTWHFSSFYFFYFTSVGVMIPYWSLFLQYRGFSATEIGYLMSVFLMTKLVAPNIWAAIADNLVARKGSSLGIVKFASLATFIIYCLMYLVHDFWSVALVMFCFCVFWNATLPQLEAATLNHLNDQRDRYGRIRLWGSVGFIVMVQGIGWLMDHTGPQIILPAGAIALLSVFMASFLLKASSSKPIPKTVSIDVPVGKLLNSKIIILLTLCVLMQISHAPWHIFFSIYLEGYGYSKLAIGSLWSAGVIFEIGVFLVGYRLLKRFDLLSMLSFTFLVAGVRWCMVALFPESGFIILITQMMHAVTYGLYHSVMIKLIDQFFQGRYQIRGQALYSSLTFGFGGAVGSLISGHIWTIYGQASLFMSAGVLMLLVFLFSFIFTSKVNASISQ